MISRAGDTQRLLATRNQQWSIVSLVDTADGSVKERYTYDHFGERQVLDQAGVEIPDTQYANPYGYTSRRHDEDSGLIYFRARYYDPTTGEFTSRDPLEYVDGMSLMRGYLAMQKVDPSGYSSCASTDCSQALNEKNVYIDAVTEWDDIYETMIPPDERTGDSIRSIIPKRKDKSTGSVRDFLDALGEFVKEKSDGQTSECISQLRIRTHGHGGTGSWFAKGTAENPNEKTDGALDDTGLNQDNAAFVFGEIKRRFCFCENCTIVLFACQTGNNRAYMDAIERESGCTILAPKGYCFGTHSDLLGPFDPWDPNGVEIRTGTKGDDPLIEDFNDRWETRWQESGMFDLVR